MLWNLRDLGPVVLVPAAWIAAAGAVLDYLSHDGLIVAHVVMVTFITFFAITGWQEMDEGAFRAWRLVLVVGIPVTLAGLAGFLIPDFEQLLWSIGLLGWMLLPAGGLAYTGQELQDARHIYLSGALLSVLGALATIGGIVTNDGTLVLTGIALVGLGQTVGIADASYRDQTT